ncbi:hypothetical protein ABT369_18205 [Dactylosporangium sp. NPDC000244]|uniref:RICIN domain-containing protein n=1 Tax=Dactylosporangium sp. NPDC000244 TaxID=3154365 RepID=UPI003333AFBA
MRRWLDMVTRRRTIPTTVRKQMVGHDTDQAPARPASIGLVRRLVAAALVGVALAATAAVVQVGEASAAPYEGVVRHFKNKATGRCMMGGDAAIYDATCDPNELRQKWERVYIKTDGMHIVALKNVKTGLCISDTGPNPPGPDFGMLDCYLARKWQQWKAWGNNWGDVILESYYSTRDSPGNQFCIDGGNRVYLNRCNGNNLYHHWSYTNV